VHAAKAWQERDVKNARKPQKKVFFSLLDTRKREFGDEFNLLQRQLLNLKKPIDQS
jgi:hypothetical protein